MDLFTPVVSEETQHPNFRMITKYANTFNCDVLNEWARGFKDRDGKFVKEFQLWELYLFAVMKHFHLEVDFSFNVPEFCHHQSRRNKCRGDSGLACARINP
jgi:hypothetical protein